MAGLALVVCVIFLSLLILGPLSYILCSFYWVPKFIKYLLSIVCVLIGIWAINVPIPLFRILGILNFGIGLRIILAQQK